MGGNGRATLITLHRAKKNPNLFIFMQALLVLKSLLTYAIFNGFRSHAW